ncbi:hypothetical protein [Cytophaga aurantiaca]|uniref:hypothetical protein n=1 Tax=Cytophaga aurantiaca TaxID=29530 RepID=UPI0003603876|nr:hypothetical protein [Cytophaga aurantiaca]
MVKIEKVNVPAIIGCIAAWGALVYFLLYPEVYDSDVVLLEHSPRKRNAKLVYLIFHFAHNFIGKSGLFLLLGIVGAIFLFYSVRFQKRINQE